MDYDREPFGWDNNSVASSAIFQDTGEDGNDWDASRKEGMEKHLDSMEPNRLGSSVPEKKPGNPIERLIREKAGKDSTEDKKRPPVADFVVDMLKVFIKAPRVFLNLWMATLSRVTQSG